MLVFYPFTFTGVCQGELCSLRDDLSDFQAANVQLLAISCDSRHAQKQWAQAQGFTFPVLSDFWPHGAVSRAYDVFNEQLGAANRATFVIDKAGTIVDVFESPNLGTPREKAAYDAALARSPSSAGERGPRGRGPHSGWRARPSGLSRHGKFVEQLLDAVADLVADRSDGFDAHAGGIVELPVFVASARVVRAGVAAAHRDDDVGGAHDFFGPRLGELAGDVDADLAPSP